jgi:hypothetical protein
VGHNTVSDDWMLLPGECLQRIARAAAMVIDVACGPMAYKTQLLA